MISARTTVLILATSLAVVTAFTPPSRHTFTATTQIQKSSITDSPPVRAPVPDEKRRTSSSAAFAEVMAPFTTHMTDPEDDSVVSFAAGLVACLVSIALGYTIGYGTLAIP